MMTLRRFAFALVLCAPGALAAQIGPQWPDPATYVGSGVEPGRLTTECVTEVEHSPQEVVEEMSCRVVAVDTIPLASRREAIAVRYLRWITASFITWQDSTQVDELILFDSPLHQGDAIPVWRRVGFDYFLGPLESGRVGRRDLVQLFNCVRGTGGCVEEVLLRTSEGWRDVELTFLSELDPHIPEGFTLHKGRRIDLATLAFVQPIAAPGDPNCCPSASLVGSVHLDGMSLRLVEVRLEPGGSG